MVGGSIKPLLQDLKTRYKFKTESDAIAYLIAVNEQRADRITLKEHQDALARMGEIQNQ